MSSEREANGRSRLGFRRWIAACALAVVLGGAGIEALANDPIQDAVDSSPVDGWLTPSGYGVPTGAAGSVDSSLWHLITDDGFVQAYNGSNNTPVDIYNTGIDNAQGITMLGAGPYGFAAVDGADHLYLLDKDFNVDEVVSIPV